MSVTQKENPEKLMLLLFPVITLSFFVAAVVIYQFSPQIYEAIVSLLRQLGFSL